MLTINTQSEHKIQIISVPNRLIKNSELQCVTFSLYVHILIKCVNSLRKIVYAQELMNIFNWSDTRALKKHLNYLHEQNAINTSFNKIYKNTLLDFEIIPIQKNEGYTMVEKNIIENIKLHTKQITFITKDRKTKEMDKKYIYDDLFTNGIRLYFYYKMKYVVAKGFAEAEYVDISKDTKMSDKTIRALNIAFDRKNIVKVLEGCWGIKQINGVCMNFKSKNKYIPMCEMKNNNNNKKCKIK